MDFYKIKERSEKSGLAVYPDWKVIRSKDLMIRGKSFYAIWDQEVGLWSTDEFDVRRLVDDDLFKYKEELEKKTDGPITVKVLSDFSTNMWVSFRNYMAHLSDSSNTLDCALAFANTDVKKTDYISKRLPYPLEAGDYKAYEEVISTLYDPDERAKIEWAIGSVVSGDSKTIQKFLVLYGEPGSGKSTILNIIQKLFPTYYSKALGSANNAFATEVFRDNPLIAIQHEGDLSRIEDNTKLNSLISHDMMTMNEKHKPQYNARANCFLFMATNKPVKISDAKSGIIRRLIDVRPSGRKLPIKKYNALMAQVDFELGAIAQHCLDVYLEMGKSYYQAYRPVDMMFQTDPFFNFVESNYFTFVGQDGITLKQSYEMYKVYCTDSGVEFPLARHKFREEFKNYFAKFLETTRLTDGNQVRSYYTGFLKEKFTNAPPPVKEEAESWLNLTSNKSLFDDVFKDRPAQYANAKEIPTKKWIGVTTTLADMDTSLLHYVAVPHDHIVIDFDLKDETGKKSSARNLEEAAKWPETYAEYSKSGGGLHLHYNWEGDTSQLSFLFAEGIEVKVFNGDATLRRKLSLCNEYPIRTINSGLPLKEAGKVINFEGVKSEKSLRSLIERAAQKEFNAGTKPAMDFIATIIQEAHDSGLSFDITDLRPKLLTFAMGSTNQAAYCIKVLSKIKFKSAETFQVAPKEEKKLRIVFFDVESYPNLFHVSWKYQGPYMQINHMVNPTAEEIARIFEFDLIGYNNRRYDNHMIYACYVGYSVEELNELSKKIIGGSPNAMFGEAYGASYMDLYDVLTKKQSLKKWQIELGIHHQEIGLPWDQPVPVELWPKVADYCGNDVSSLEVAYDANPADVNARKILAELSGLPVNDTTSAHTAKILFGDDKHPQSEFIYTDLSIMFPGYTYDAGKSSYRGECPGEGGLVYAEPGMYKNVGLYDVGGMHPTSVIELNLFGDRYTRKYSDIFKTRIAVKHKDFETAKTMLDGVVAKYLGDKSVAKDMANALKLALNQVYGLSSASFDNKFKDPRNKDNIVAKRGALFMIDLKHAVQEKGFTVAHIKTDSIKIPEATPEIEQFVFEFGKKYGYTFEHEASYDRLCLVNNAVYIARDFSGKWSATGAEFAHPYIFKSLFSHEPLAFEDYCETFQVTTALYLDMDESLPEGEHNYRFVGKVGSFVPIKPGYGAGKLLREKEGKYSSATGAKEWRWLEAEVVKELGLEDAIDMAYFKILADNAVKHISEFGDFNWFVEPPFVAPEVKIVNVPDDGKVPWVE
jgi:energy-coupling factor transporter ATP-binding protein EcfA2